MPDPFSPADDDADLPVIRARSLGPRPVLLDRERGEPPTWRGAALGLLETLGVDTSDPVPDSDGFFTDPMRALAGGRFGTDKRLTREEYDARRTGMAIAGGFGDGGLAGVVSPARAMSLPMRRGASDPELLSRAAEYSPSARSTGDGLLLEVRRQQKPEQGGSASPREGVFYLPESEPKRFYGRDEAKHGGGPSWYGGSERIEGQTLLRAPLLARGATGGRVVEDALDRLLGKGTAQRVESDANRVSLAPWQGRGEAGQLDEARAFLEAWGGDPALAEHILRTSRAGNRLRYALTENAAGQLARAEGYDSILGVSRSREKPRFTELFDLREATFPRASDPYGTRLHDHFEGLLSRGRLPE